MTGPAYHGRTHIPGGTDPISGLEDLIDTAVGGASTTGLPVCYASATAFSLAADAAWHKPEWTTVTTNNATVFAQDLGNPENIHFAAGHYLVGYEIYAATPPTSPDYFEATPSIFGMESFPSPGRGFVGDFSKIKDTTMEFSSDISLYRFQDFQVFPPALDSAGGDGYFHLLLRKLAGAAVTLSIIRMFMVRLSGSGDVAGPGDSGIFYDLANVGDWLQVETTGTGATATTDTGGYSGLGVAIVDHGDGGMLLGTSGNGDITLDAGNNVNIKPVDGNINLTGGPFSQLASTLLGGYTLQGGPFLFSGDSFEADSDGGLFLSSADSNGMQFALTGGGTFSVLQAGVSVFQIRPDGTVHIKTGGTIHADL